MSFIAHSIHCRSMLISSSVEITLEDGTKVDRQVQDDIDWHWFSDNGFLDATSGEEAWDWVQPIKSIQFRTPQVGDFTLDKCLTVETVNLSKNTKSIGESAFYRCINLNTITGLDNVTSIGDWAFDRCLKLRLDHLPTDLTQMGKGAFANCELLVGDITIPSGVTEIGEQTFVNCTGITGITIHSGVESIGEIAFEGCTSLTRMTFSGRTKDEVLAMENAPWGIDPDIINA